MEKVEAEPRLAELSTQWTLVFEARAGTPQEIYDRLKSDIDKWRAVIEKAGIEKQ